VARQIEERWTDIERHVVSNPLALRWLERQLLANPGGAFSVRKHHDTLRSQGLPIGKDTLYEYLAYLEDAFLVRRDLPRRPGLRPAILAPGVGASPGRPLRPFLAIVSESAASPPPNYVVDPLLYG
jgi:hypothetical protein